MKLIPYESWEIKTPLQISQLVGAMTRKIEQPKWFRWPLNADHTLLQGTINQRGFTVSRVIHYRNSCLPVMTGKFIPYEAGTRSKIAMTLHPIVIASMAVWSGMLALFSLVGIVALVTQGQWTFVFVTGGMAIFGVALTCGSFWAEAGKTRDGLAQVMMDIHKEVANNPLHPTGQRPPPLPIG